MCICLCSASYYNIQIHFQLVLGFRYVFAVLVFVATTSVSSAYSNSWKFNPCSVFGFCGSWFFLLTSAKSTCISKIKRYGLNGQPCPIPECCVSSHWYHFHVWFEIWACTGCLGGDLNVQVTQTVLCEELYQMLSPSLRKSVLCFQVRLHLDPVAVSHKTMILTYFCPF